MLSCFAAFETRYGRAWKLGNSQDKTQRRKKVWPPSRDGDSCTKRVFGEKANYRASTPLWLKRSRQSTGSSRQALGTGRKRQKKRKKKRKAVDRSQEVGNAGTQATHTVRIAFFPSFYFSFQFIPPDGGRLGGRRSLIVRPHGFPRGRRRRSCPPTVPGQAAAA